MTAYWRQAGLSYLKYVNLCSEFVRNGLKVRGTEGAWGGSRQVYREMRPDTHACTLPLMPESALPRCRRPVSG